MSCLAPLAATDTLICLHSSASSGHQWQPMRPSLQARHLTVLTPDLLGYGRQSPWPAGQFTTLEAEAAALAPLLPADGAHLFGHSYGAAVALQVAYEHPTLVKSLTLYEPVRFARLFADAASLPLAREVVAVARAVHETVAEGDWRMAAECFVDYWSGGGAWARLPARQQEAVAARMPKVAADFDALFRDTTPVRADAALTMPVRLVVGTRSPLPTRRIAGLLTTSLPRARLVRAEGLGHMGPVQAPFEVLQALGWAEAREPMRREALALAA